MVRSKLRPQGRWFYSLGKAEVVLYSGLFKFRNLTNSQPEVLAAFASLERYGKFIDLRCVQAGWAADVFQLNPDLPLSTVDVRE